MLLLILFYSGLCCTGNRVFAVNAFSTDPHMNTNAFFFIHVFDWDGNFKYMLNAAHPLKYPYLDAEKGHLYAIDEEDNILLYDISRFL